MRDEESWSFGLSGMCDRFEGFGVEGARCVAWC